MWGKLNQMVGGDQQKIENLEAQLEEETQRNKTINDQFKKVLKEKEKEIHKLKANAGTSAGEGSSNGVTDDREEMREELIKLQRKLEEYQMLNTQKDENVNVLMQQVNEAEELKDKVEAQERINSEKLMFELAGRIDSHEKISNKLEEMRAVLEQKNGALTEMADEMGAKDQMLKAKDEAIKKLRVLSNAEKTEELISSLEKTAADKDRQLEQLRRNVTHLEDERTKMGKSSGKSSNTSTVGNKDIASLMEKLKQRDESIEQLLHEKEEMDNRLTTLDEEHRKYIQESQEKDNTITALKCLTSKLESESHVLHGDIAESDDQIATLQRLLEESERKVVSLERENKDLSLEYAAKVGDLENLQERLELSQLEATSFREQHDSEVAHTANLTKQLVQLGDQLSQQTEGESKHTESLEEQMKELTELRASTTSVEKENAILQQKTQELQSINANLHTDIQTYQQYQKRINELESMLVTSQYENELKKSELSLAQQKLNMSSGTEHTLCEQITKLHTDNENLNQSMIDLEATILQLDGDMNAYQTNINKYKLQEEELRDGLAKANEEREGSECKVREMQETLRELAEDCNGRKRTREEHYIDLKKYSDIVEKEKMQSASKDGKMLNEVLNILEDERFELEQLLQIAIKQKDDFMEKNSQLEALLLSEREKFERVLETSSKLKADLSEKGEQRDALSYKLEEEITSLQSLLKATEEQCRDSSQKELEMKECVDILEKDLAQKEEEILTLQEKSSKLQNMVEDGNTTSQEEKSILEEKVNTLEKHNQQLQQINYEKASECSSLQETLSSEYQARGELERNIKTLEDEKQSYHQYTVTQQTKINELIAANEATLVESQETALQVDRLLHTLQEKETKENCIEEHLQTKEAGLQTMEKKLREVEEHLVYSQDNNHKLKEELSVKEHTVCAITEELTLKEESLRLLSQQIENLSEENNSMKKSESTLNTKLVKFEEDNKILQGQYDCFVALSNTEALKGDKLSDENTKLNVELIQRNGEVVSLQSTLKGKEEEIQTLSESFKLKEAYTEKLDSDLQEIENEYYSLKEENTKLQTIIAEKEEEVKLTNSNLVTKEDSVISLHNQIENFKKEVLCMKENECALNLAMKNNMEQIDNITWSLNSKEESVRVLAEEVAELKKERDSLKENLSEKVQQFEVIDSSRQQQDIVAERLKEELQKTELDYQQDLGEAESIYNDLQKQFESSRDSESSLQSLLVKKNEEIDELLAERKATIFRHDEEKTALKASIFSLEESHYDKMEEKDKDYETRLDEKNTHIHKLNESVEDLEGTLKHSNDVSMETIEHYSKKEKELVIQMKALEKGLHQKDEELLMVIQVKNSFDELVDQSNCEVDELRNILAAKEANFKAIESDLTAIREKETELMATNNEKDLEIKKLTAELGNVMEENEATNADLVEKEKKIIMLSSHLRDMNNENESAVNDMNVTISQKEEVIMDLQTLVQSTNNEQTQQLQNLISEKEEMKVNFVSMIREKEDEMMAINDEKDLEIQTLSTELGKVTEQNEVINADLVEKEKEIIMLNSHLRDMNNENESAVNDMNVTISQKEEMIMDLQTFAQSTNNEQTQQLQNLISEKEEMKVNFVSMIREKEDLMMAVNDELGKVTEQNERLLQTLVQSTNNELTQQLQNLISVNEEMKINFESMIREKEETIVELNEQVTYKDNVITDIEGHLQDVCDKNKEEKEIELSLHQSSFQTLQTEDELLKTSLTKLQQQVKNSSEEKQFLQESMLEKDQLINNLQLSLQEKNQTVDLLQHQEAVLIEKCSSMEKESTENKNVVSDELLLKDKEISKLLESVTNQKNQFDSLKEKTARILKKSQAMKKVLQEKEKQIEVLTDQIASWQSQHLEVANQITTLQNDVKILQCENEGNKEVIRTQADELESHKLACHEKDNQINELNYVLSQYNQPPSHTSESVDGSIAGSVPSETSVLTATNDLEWDPSACINNKAQVDDEQVVCSYLQESFNEGVAAATVSDMQCNVFPSADVEKSQNQRLIAEVQQLNETLSKSHKKNALLKKSQIELAKEIEVLQDLPNKMELEVTSVREELGVSQEHLYLSENLKMDVEVQVLEMQQMILVALGEDTWPAGDDKALLMDKVLKVKEEKEELKNVQQQFAKLQDVYERLSGEFANMTSDWECLQNQKLEKEETIELLNHKYDQLKLASRRQSEMIIQSVADILCTSDEDDEVEIPSLEMPGEEADEEAKTLVENLKSVTNKLKKEKMGLLEQMENEKLLYARNCEEEKEAMKELQMQIKTESSQEIELLKEELESIAERQLNADKLQERERSLKDNALRELEVLREQISVTISEQQLARVESAQEAESKLLLELDIERELREVKEQLNISNATKEHLQEAVECEQLLKQQLAKENDFLKSEINIIKEEQQQSSDTTSSNVEEVKKHKDQVIKKLKLKLRKELSEKELLSNSLNESIKISETVTGKEDTIQQLTDKLNESIKVSETVTEKEDTIHQLTDKIYQISEEREQIVFDSTREISEKDDLINALKDELSWLKTSMEPLITKSDNADKLQHENTALKYCIESKDDEVSHLRESALLKENELTYLIDQEKQVQDEYVAEIEKLKVENEDRKQSLKTMNDEIQWLQTQVEQMAPKSDQLAVALGEVNTFKENLNNEAMFRKELESQVHSMKEAMSEKAVMNENLQNHCQILQNKLDNIISNKEEVEEMNSSFKDLEELCSSKDDEIAQMNESLQTREVQLEDVKSDLVEKTGAYEELQAMLQNKDIETHQLATALNQERQANAENDLAIKESSEEMCKLKDQVALLTDEITQLDELLMNEADKYDNINKELEKMKLANQQLVKTEDFHKQDSDQLNQSLHERDNKYEELSQTCNQKDTLIEELRYQLQCQEHNIVQLNSQFGEKDGELQLKDGELQLKDGELQLKDGELQLKTTEIDQLTARIISFELLDSQYQESSRMNMDQEKELLKVKKSLQIKNVDLDKIEEELQEKLVEVEQLNVMLQEKEKIILENDQHLQEQNSKLQIEQESISTINTNLTNLVMQFSDDVVPSEIEIQLDTITPAEQSAQECPIEDIKKMIAGQHEELHSLKDLLTEKQNEMEILISANAELLQQMDSSRQEYETTICQLQESISEKDLPANDIPANDIPANDLPENMQALDFVEVAPEHDDNGWDDACGWESIDNVETENIQQQHEADIDLRKEIEELKDEKVKLSETCDHKETVVAKLKNKLRQVIAEKDTLKEKCQGVEQLAQEVTTLKETTETLKGNNDTKETTIGKLKSKLKQTMRGRDQLKENLQSELDRIAQEKDLIFNEFSEKLQQQNKEVSDLKNGSEVMSKTLQSFEETLAHKEDEVKKLQCSLNMKNESCKESEAVYSEMKVKCDELENEKASLTLDVIQQTNMLEKSESENSEKEKKISENEIKVSDLELELEKSKRDKSDFDEITSTLEETMAVKDHSLEKLRQQLENLQREYVKLNSDYQASLNKHKTSAAHYDDMVSGLNEKLTLFQEEKENMTIKAGEYKAELEAVEILTGFSKENTSLLEQVGTWQLQTNNKIKDYERQLKYRSLEDKDVHSLMENIEKICKISCSEGSAITERLKKLHKCVHKLKQSMKGGAVTVEEQVGNDENLEMMLLEGAAAAATSCSNSEADDINVTYQLLDNKIKALTALTQELQQKMLSLDTEAARGSSESNTSYVTVSPAVIDQIALIKSQLEKDILYSKTEWIHLQNENTNLKRQVNLLSNFSDDAASKSGSNLEDVIVKKNAALLELQKSFEVVINQKDIVVDSLRKRIGELRDQLLTARSPVDQFSQFHMLEKDRETPVLTQSSPDVEVTAHSDSKEVAGETANADPTDSVVRKELDAVLKMNESDQHKIRCIQLKRELSALQHKLSASIIELTSKEEIIEKNNTTIASLISCSQSDVNSLNQELEKKVEAANDQIGVLENEKKSFEEMLAKLREELKTSKETAHNEYQELQKRFEETSLLFESKNTAIENIQTEYQDLEKRVEETMQLLESKNTSIETAQTEYKELEKRLGEATQLLQSKDSSQESAQEELAHLEKRFKETTQLLESKSNQLEEKLTECNDLIEENQDCKEEIADLKESLQEQSTMDSQHHNNSWFKEQIANLEIEAEQYDQQIQELNEKIDSLESSKSSLEAAANLREAEQAVSTKENEATQFSSELQETRAQLDMARSATATQHGINVKDDFVRSKSIIEDELAELRVENTLLKKQMEVLTSIDNTTNENESKLQGEILKKNEGFLELRGSFEDVIAQKDIVIDSLRKSVNKYRSQSLNAHEGEFNQYKNQIAEKDTRIAELSQQIHNIQNENNSLKNKLELTVIEKNKIDGHFENISSGLRNDLELAFKEKRQYSDNIEIHCLQLERDLNTANDQLSNANEKVKLQEGLVNEKNIVISNLQNQISGSASKTVYKFLQEQVAEANKSISTISMEKNILVEELTNLSETHESLKLEVEVIANEKNQVKLEMNSQIQDILLRNAEEIENLRNTFGESLSENNTQISQLTEYLAVKEEEGEAVVKVHKNKLKESEEVNALKINELEMQLDVLINEKENRMKEIAVDAEKRKSEEITNFEKDFTDLLAAKDEKIHHVSSQLNESQQKHTELNKTLEQKGENIATLNHTVKTLKDNIVSLKETNRKLEDGKANDIRETIITKGKQLKDLREEFETVFDEKNNIIENIRSTLKSSRNELVQTQEKLRCSHEDARNLEQQIVELETEKLELDEKLSCLLNRQTSSDPYILKEEQGNVTNSENLEKLRTIENDFVIAKKANEEMSEILASINDIIKHVQDTNGLPRDSLPTLSDRVQHIVDKYLDFCNNSSLKDEDITEKDATIVKQNYDLANFRTDSAAFQSIIETVNDITGDIPGLDYYDDSLTGVKEKVEQIVSNLTSSQRYCDELSMKLYELMEPKSSQDFSSQAQHEGKDMQVKKLEERITYLQKELYESVSDKETIENTVREEYDDILENLRGDLDESKNGYRLLQEENFSLRNQLDVYTNVTIKRLHSRQSSDASSQSVASVAVSVEEPTPKVKEVAVQKQVTADAANEVETAELKVIIGKLKKLVKKYKNEVQTHKNELTLRGEEVKELSTKLSTSTEVNSDGRNLYEQEIKSLREDIASLVAEKEEMVGKFKSRSGSDLMQMKEAYQISLNKLNQDVQTKDNLIEQHECEIEILKVSSSPAHHRGRTTSSSSSTAVEDEVNQLKKRKEEYQVQVQSCREEISQLVQEKENLVTLWKTKFDGAVDENDALLNQVAVLTSKLLQASCSDVETLDGEVPQHFPSTMEEPGKEPEMTEDSKKLHVSILQHFPASTEEVNLLRTDNKDKDVQLQHYRDAITELELKIVNERVVTNSLSQEITSLKSERMELEERFHREFQQQIKVVVNKNNLLQLQLNSHKCEQMVNEKDNSVLYQSATTVENNELKSQVSSLSNEKAELLLRIMTVRSMLEQEVKEHDKTKTNKTQIIHNQSVTHSNYSSLKSTASDLHYTIKSIKSQLVTTNSIINDSYREFITTVLPVMVSDDYEYLKTDIQQKASELLQKDNELVQKDASIANKHHEKKLAESRLFDVVVALQELGVIEKVQAKLVEKESSLKKLHKFIVKDEDVDELKQRLVDKDNLIAEYEGKIFMLEDKIEIWRGQYLSEDQLRGVSPHGGTQDSRVSELIDWPESEQGSVVSEIGSMVSAASRHSVAPPTPTMDRN